MKKNDEVILSKNQKELESFSKYCIEHPKERFWQALRNWSKVGYILTAEEQDDIRWIGIHDTFYD